MLKLSELQTLDARTRMEAEQTAVWKSIIGELPKGFFISISLNGDNGDYLNIIYNGENYDKLCQCGGGKPTEGVNIRAFRNINPEITSKEEMIEFVQRTVAITQQQLARLEKKMG